MAGGSAASGTAVCMGGCSLPFNLSASAPGYISSPTWLENHGASSATTHYPEGNENTANYTVYLDPNLKSDLVVRNAAGGTSPSINGPTTVSVGQDATYTFTTKNIGDAASGVNTTTRASAAGSTNTSDDFTVGSLSAGGTSGVHSFTTSWGTSGSKTVTFTADYNNDVTNEKDEANSISITVTVQAINLRFINPQPTLDPAGSGPGGSYHKGDTVTLRQVNIQNEGPGAIPNSFKVRFCYDNANCAATETITTITCPSCPSGTTWNLNFAFPNAPNSNGNFTWYVKIDSGDEVTESVETNGDNVRTGPYTVAGVRAWFLAADGNVGSLGNITIQKPPPIGYSTTYIGIAQGAISVFNSAKGWIISGYNPINLKPAPVGGSIYDVLLTKYKPKIVTNMNAAIPAGGGIFKYVPGGGTLALNNTNWTKGPTMIFVEGKLRFNGDFTSNANTGMVFVANQDVEIQSNVQTVASVIFFDGSFKSGKSGVGNPDEQLRMIGGIVGGFESGSTITLERDLGINNDTLPAEEFKFEPKYLWYFKELIGELKPVFEELTP